MVPIDLHARVAFRSFDRGSYQWRRFTVPVYDEGKGGKRIRPVTEWERKCLDTANAFLEQLFSVPGFTDWFVRNHCCVKKHAVLSFLAQAGSGLVFPDTPEYKAPFGWGWCQHDGGRDAPGHILDCFGWLYDTLAYPEITVAVDGTVYEPFMDDIHCFESCAEDDCFAWRLCRACIFTFPQLFHLAGRDMNCVYEGTFSADMDPGLLAVLKLFDEEILPVYNVIVGEDSPALDAGTYPMHIADVSRPALQALILENKEAIAAALEKSGAD